MSKKNRRRRKQYENPINTHVAKTLTQIEDVAEVLKDGLADHTDKLDEALNSIYVLEQALEMNFWVELRMGYNGHFDLESDARMDPEIMVTTAQEYQQEYLAVLAVITFFTDVAKSEEAEGVDPQATSG